MHPTGRYAHWSWGRIIGYTALLIFIAIVAQTVAVIAMAVVQAMLVPGFRMEKWLLASDNNGLALSIATLASTALAIPTAWLLVRMHEPHPWDFLGVRPVSGRTLAIAVGAILLFVAVSDPINVYGFDRPLVPEFMLAAYNTSRPPLFLFIAVAVLAPIAEELLFRGFLFGALRARGLRVRWVILITSVLFMLMHTQYDWHDAALVFIVGVIFAVARAKFDSVLPSIAMHAVGNAVAFVETAIVARG